MRSSYNRDAADGDTVGAGAGALDGDGVRSDVGAGAGAADGDAVGAGAGALDGDGAGSDVGSPVGWALGNGTGTAVGAFTHCEPTHTLV